MQTLKFKTQEQGQVCLTPCPHKQGSGQGAHAARIGSVWCKTKCTYFNGLNQTRTAVKCLHETKNKEFKNV